jgi:predicted nucleic acid-binding protein
MHYLDTSALVKLVVDEEGSAAFREWALAREGRLISSDLARTELLRAVRRVHPDRVVLARHVLDSVELLRLEPTDFDAAGRLGPEELRSLDALHLAAALALGDELESIVTYGERLAQAARLNGVAVDAPM